MTAFFRSIPFLCLICVFGGSFGRGELVEGEQQRLADGLYARGLYDLALVEYQKLILGEPQPSNLDVLYYRAGECASRTGKGIRAEEYFEEAVRIGGRSVAAQRSQYRLADRAYRNGNIEEAAKQLRDLQQEDLDPSIEVPVLFTYARILESRKQNAEALEIYEDLLQEYPEDSLSVYAALRVAALSSSGEDVKRASYQKALENPPTRDFEIEALWGLAGLERRVKNYPEAATLYWRLWTKFPDSTRVRGSMIHLAWAQLQAGEFKKAQELSRQTSEARKAPDADTWLYLDAVSYEQLGDSEAAIQSFETLLEDYPDSRFRSVAVYETAGNYAAKGEHTKVLAYSKELQQIPGREAEGLWLLAESARGAGETRQALQTYTRIAHQFPDHEKAPDALYFKAQLLVNTGDAEDAAQALSDFRKQYPEDPRSLQALEQAGDLLVKSGQLNAGLEKWVEVLDSSEESDVDMEFKTAMLEIRLEHFAKAQQRLEELLAEDLSPSERANSTYWLGVLLDRQGENEAAQQALEAAISEDLKAEWRDAARMRLGQSFIRSDQPEKALDTFRPFLGTAEESELSDSLLLWLLPAAVSRENPKVAIDLSKAMTNEMRKPATRELGYYALAEAESRMGNPEKAVKAWEKGLAFDSGTLEAAEAHLKFADFLLEQENYPKSFTHYSEASRLASSLEEERYQALGIMGSGRVRMAQKNWPDAARYFMSVAVLYEDPVLSPEALRSAETAFRNAGQTANADAARKERETRYPESFVETP